MVDPISSCVRSLLIASTMMMMMTMTGMETPIQKRLYGWRNRSQRRRYKHAGAASVVVKSSQIEPRGALGCRLCASRVQGRSGGVPKIEFFIHLAPFDRFWIPLWRLLDFEGVPKFTIFAQRQQKITQKGAQGNILEKHTFGSGF